MSHIWLIWTWSIKILTTFNGLFLIWEIELFFSWDIHFLTSITCQISLTPNKKVRLLLTSCFWLSFSFYVISWTNIKIIFICFPIVSNLTVTQLLNVIIDPTSEHEMLWDRVEMKILILPCILLCARGQVAWCPYLLHDNLRLLWHSQSMNL